MSVEQQGFEALREYKRIGWDFDETLIQHHLSDMFWDFIERNPFNQTHVIVTFRSGGLERLIFPDLLNAGSKLREQHFEGVLSIPHQQWVDYQITKESAYENDDPYLFWKGLICQENKIDVLIDDDLYAVIRGCEQYSIPHIHPDDLAS